MRQVKCCLSRLNLYIFNDTVSATLALTYEGTNLNRASFVIMMTRITIQHASPSYSRHLVSNTAGWLETRIKTPYPSLYLCLPASYTCSKGASPPAHKSSTPLP